jgi:hypothetical protein
MTQRTAHGILAYDHKEDTESRLLTDTFRNNVCVFKNIATNVEASVEAQECAHWLGCD